MGLLEDLHLGDSDGQTALSCAATGGHARLVQHLLDLGHNPNVSDGDGALPLHIAAANGYAPVVRVLLHAGARVDGRALDGSTARDAAMAAGNKAILDLLLVESLHTQSPIAGVFGRMAIS